MSKIQQTKQDLEKELEEQLSLLELHCKTYDEGNTLVAKHIATLIRVLVHDTKNSQSLLGQLDKKGDFYDSSPQETNLEGVIYLGARSFLVGGGMGKNSQYIPFLDDTPQKNIGFCSFDEWWNRLILTVDQDNTFSRKYIVLKLANQAGGAHVDPELDEKYYKLTKENLVGVEASFNGEKNKAILGIELAIVRQIGHEILKTFRDKYHKKIVTHGSMAIVGGVGGMLTSDPNIILEMMERNNKPDDKKV